MPGAEPHLRLPLGHEARIGYAAVGLAAEILPAAFYRMAPESALELGRKVLAANPEADTLLLPCPHWNVVDAIQPLQDQFGVDVVTNFQATLWDALSTLGLTEPIPGYGRLLREFPAGPQAKR